MEALVVISRDDITELTAAILDYTLTGSQKVFVTNFNIFILLNNRFQTAWVCLL